MTDLLITIFALTAPTATLFLIMAWHYRTTH